MGLDISAYSNVEFVTFGDHYDQQLEYSGGVNQTFINPDFPHAVPPFADGRGYVWWEETSQTESDGFCAGSYSGYGLFRSVLAGAFLGTKDLYSDREGANGDWTKVGKSEGKPFYEVVNFSDCEGVFFGPVCEKLYKDFYANRETFVDFVTHRNPYPAYEAERFINIYDDFTKAFELAAVNGLVIWH